MIRRIRICFNSQIRFFTRRSSCVSRMGSIFVRWPGKIMTPRFFNFFLKFRKFMLIPFQKWKEIGQKSSHVSMGLNTKNTVFLPGSKIGTSKHFTGEPLLQTHWPGTSVLAPRDVIFGSFWGHWGGLWGKCQFLKLGQNWAILKFFKKFWVKFSNLVKNV